jgi:hypothetical protein
MAIVGAVGDLSSMLLLPALCALALLAALARP